MIHKGMVAGAPFPELLSWTYGEIIEFIECRNEARKEELQLNARIQYQTALTAMHMMNCKKGQTFCFDEEYSFLFTAEERKEIERARQEAFIEKMMAQFEAEYAKPD